MQGHKAQGIAFGAILRTQNTIENGYGFSWGLESNAFQAFAYGAFQIFLRTALFSVLEYLSDL